ncbi:Gamma-aminobutyrate transporter, APC family protein [Nostocoides japonicum T1-X7]|uniref:Gamma-aminobutyrate transporter, APC family protein n=1 Tax=Nostocoides japonicum T1-X7 TaxID=1194083 RepID=A0A077M0B6_9MICO|nr:amino acid permease [Tetrasphaera japonica]CCH79678.1 Gamma-aminobutyrate transporter, APC family protein [Tetrasphaera japonica T1-X7]
MAGAGPELKKGLNQRQLTMIAMGGVIGAGLFVGSGAVIEATGPGAFLTYALCGVLIIMVMRMLAEMAVAHPSTGSFSDYARTALGDWAGFSVAWLYWYFWVIVVGFEAVAGAKVINFWLPDAPTWVLSLILMMLMTGTNLISVSSFGEFEFWFAGIKVAAIIVFLVTGTLFILGLWPGAHLDFSNLTAHGGFLPKGGWAITAGVVTVIFSMVGAEIATIAAAESDNPEKAVAKAANSVITRISLFFVGSIFLLAVILPWNSDDLAASPYVSAFEKIGIPFADHIMNAVVLTAVLSCLNSGMYTASRMLFVLAARREAPAAMVSVNSRGVPVVAILTSSVIGFLCVIVAAISPDKVFSFLLNSSGAVILFVYLLICISQIVLRYRTDESRLKVKMWLFPALSALTTLAIIAVLVQMALEKDVRIQLWLSLLSWAVFLVLFFINRARIARLPEPIAPEPTGTAHRVLVLANQTLGSDELVGELRRIDATGKAEYYVCVPASPVETGVAATHGAVSVADATVRAAQERLDTTLETLRSHGLAASGALGDYRPLRALQASADQFKPDQIVVVTLPASESVWQRFDVVDRAQTLGIPVTHVEAKSLSAV